MKDLRRSELKDFLVKKLNLQVISKLDFDKKMRVLEFDLEHFSARECEALRHRIGFKYPEERVEEKDSYLAQLHKEVQAKRNVSRWQTERKERQLAKGEREVRDMRRWEEEQEQRRELFLQEARLKYELKALKIYDDQEFRKDNLRRISRVGSRASNKRDQSGTTQSWQRPTSVHRPPSS